MHAIHLTQCKKKKHAKTNKHQNACNKCNAKRMQSSDRSSQLKSGQSCSGVPMLHRLHRLLNTLTATHSYRQLEYTTHKQWLISARANYGAHGLDRPADPPPKPVRDSRAPRNRAEAMLTLFAFPLRIRVTTCKPTHRRAFPAG